MISLDCKIKKYILIFSFFAAALFSVSGEEISNRELLFQIALYNIKGTSSLENADFYYFPQSLKRIINRYVFTTKGNRIYLPDLYFPLHKGEIQASGFADFSSESGQWLDEFLISQEEERIAGELSTMDDKSEKYEIFDSGNLEEEITDAIEKGGNETYYFNQKNELSRMEYEGEFFIVKSRNNGFEKIVNFSDELRRSFYNKNYRLTRNEVWTLDGKTKLKGEEYFYDEAEGKLKSKNLVDYKASPVQKTEIFYNENGLVKEEKTYVLLEDNTKELLIQNTVWTYDDKNRIVATVQKIYSFTDDTYKIQKDIFTKKNLYKYSEKNDLPADEEYYEDSVLKMRLTYEDKTAYTRQYFFEDNFSVISYYKNNKCVREVYYSGNQPLREKSYEQK